MTDVGFTLFDTAVGRCAVAWGGHGIVALHLPASRDQATRAGVLARFPGAQEGPPPPVVQRAVDAVTALLRDGTGDLSAVELDLRGVPPFHRRVYAEARTIPPGSTTTYGELAARIGSPGSARAVGQALGRNPFAIVVPCHRVLAAGGRVGGFSAHGGTTTKLRLLAGEGATTDGGPRSGAGRLGYDPDRAVGHLRDVDPGLAALVDRAGPFGLRLRTTPSLFAALTQAVVHQQLSGRDAATIHARLCGLFPRAVEGPTAGQLLAATDEQLRGAGLSRSKVLSLRDLARHDVEGLLPDLGEARGLDDEELVARLTRVRGVGRWTVEMLLIFRLGRPDVLPLDDLGIRKGFAAAFGTPALPTAGEVEARGERWRPYRSVASWYLWRAAEA